MLDQISPETYYAAKKRQEEQGAVQNEKMRALREQRRVLREMTAAGWTTTGALAHIEGSCDIYTCASTDHDDQR